MEFILDNKKDKIFTYIDWKKIYFSEEEVLKIQKWCIYKDWEIIETEEYKQNLLKEEKNKIEAKFQETIKQITAWYSQAEIDTWNTKVAEAKKVLAGEWSEILEQILIEWETIEELATRILEKAKQYAEIYYKAEKEKRQVLKELEAKYNSNK